MPRVPRRGGQERRRLYQLQYNSARRSNPQQRDLEQQRDTEARRNRRRDPSYRSQEQLSGTLTHRRSRASVSSSESVDFDSPANSQLWSQHADMELQHSAPDQRQEFPEVAHNLLMQDSDTDDEPQQNELLPTMDDTEDNQAWWTIFPYNSVRPLRHNWSRTCLHCGVPLLTSELRSFCCTSGTKTLTRLPPLPQALEEIFSGQGFSHKSRKINSLFSFSSIGVDGSFVYFPGGVSSIVLHGRTYHRIIPGNTLTSPLRWILYDSNARLEAAVGQAISPDLVNSILDALSEINPFIHSLKRLAEQANPDAVLELNTTTAGDEIAAIIHTDNTTGIGPRSIAIHYYTEEQPTFVNSLHPLYEALQYPLLFPHGSPGWGIHHELSQIWYYRLRLFQEDRFRRAGRLTNEYLVDMYSRVEEERLNYLRFNQPAPGMDEGIEAEGGPTAARIYLPSTFVCGARWQSVQTADALAIVSRYGKPTFFITFTTNPNWPEIKSQLDQNTNQNYADIPFVVVRAFHQRLKKLKDFIRKKMGPVVYMIHVVEFQKRGLPHAHIAVKLSKEPISPDEINQVVLAEVPQEDGRLKNLVLNHMLHNHSSRCKTSSGCHYQYPKQVKDTTTIDERGYVIYRRRTAQDVNVVPYNPHLLLLLESHINVEMANSVNLIMYLYKYMYKGSDMAAINITVPEDDNSEVDEIQDYVKCRYLSAPEASWRIMQYHMTEKTPAVTCLKVHLPEKSFTFGRNGLSRLERYFLRPQYEPFSSMTFTTYYEQCTFETAVVNEDDPLQHLEIPKDGETRREVRFRSRGKSVARLQMLYPSAGEVYYVRLLLAHRPAVSFTDMKIVDGIEHRTFQQAAIALGLFVDSDEGFLCFTEARDNLHSPYQLRLLFCELILDGSPAIPLWETFQQDMIQDYFEDYQNEDRARNKVLEIICRYIEERNHHMSDYGLPQPALHTLEAQVELERWNADPDEQLLAANSMYAQMNQAQREIYDAVVAAVNTDSNLILFIDGKAGRGKTFLMQAIMKAVRSQGIIAIPTGTTALAASNYAGGRTAHSLFRIPVEQNSELLTSTVNPSSERWNLLRETKLFVWDEFPMVNKAAFLCAENLMEDIMNQASTFGGKIFIALGDFRQVAPVVTRGGRRAIVMASVRTLPIWADFRIKPLTQPIRDAEDQDYSHFVDEVGDGTSGEDVDISILKHGSENEVIEFVYPEEILSNPNLCVTRSILCPLNVSVDSMNIKILKMLPGEEFTLYSTDSLKEKLNPNNNAITRMNSPFATSDFLNMQNAPGIPHHVLKIKVGSICNLMRNLSQDQTLCKNTRVIVKKITRRYVQVEKISGSGPNRLYLLPRMDFFFDLPNTPWKIHRKQFPLRLSYSNTFNSAQGLTLECAGFDLRIPVFCHGQLYTGLSRIRGRNYGMVIVSEPQHTGDALTTKNIVYPELLL